MGIIDKIEKRERDKPDLPSEMLDVYLHYKRVRFGRAVGEDSIMLVPRNALNYAELESYNRQQLKPLRPHEIEIIMDIDAIFECREAKG